MDGLSSNFYYYTLTNKDKCWGGNVCIYYHMTFVDLYGNEMDNTLIPLKTHATLT